MNQPGLVVDKKKNLCERKTFRGDGHAEWWSVDVAEESRRGDIILVES